VSERASQRKNEWVNINNKGEWDGNRECDASGLKAFETQGMRA
jgi:hypothetical protein